MSRERTSQGIVIRCDFCGENALESIQLEIREGKDDGKRLDVCEKCLDEKFEKVGNIND